MSAREKHRERERESTVELTRERESTVELTREKRVRERARERVLLS